MELKDIKALQDMGYSLEQIKEVYFPDQAAAAPETPSQEQPQAMPEAGKKKDSSADSSEDLKSLRAELSSLKNLIFKQNASENKGSASAPESSADILKNMFNKEV